MYDLLIDRLKQDPQKWDQCRELFREKHVPAKTILLEEGEVSHQIFFVRKGCLRLCFNHHGKDISFQFFFENQGVSSFDSFLNGHPSLFGLESIEPSDLVVMQRKDFDRVFQEYPDLKDGFQQILLKRLENYATLFLSRIKNSPAERYAELMEQHPEVILRVPQHYIASYLGVSPVSLSRIRNRR